MKYTNRNLSGYILSFSVIITGLICSLVTFSVYRHYTENVHSLYIKSIDYVKNETAYSINNIISEIQIEKQNCENQLDMQMHNVNSIYETFYIDTNSNGFLSYASFVKQHFPEIEFLLSNNTTQSYYKIEHSGDAALLTPEQNESEASKIIKSSEISSGDTVLTYGYTKDTVKKNVTDFFLNEAKLTDGYGGKDIHDVEFAELLNINGGENYARLFLCSESDKSVFLSTNTPDTKVNQQRLEILNVLRKANEAFWETDNKITYYKLYHDFSWIVSMSSDLEDINNDKSVRLNESTDLLKKYLFYIAITVLTIVLMITLFMNINIKTHTVSNFETNNDEIDPLTSCVTQRRFLDILTAQFNIFQTNMSVCSFIKLDIDSFSTINERFGYPIGDRILIDISRILKNQSRDMDTVCRWEGDSFVVLLCNADTAAAAGFARRILNSFEQYPIAIDGKDIKLALSIGVSSFYMNDRDEIAVLLRLDRALYNCKTKATSEICTL